MATVWSLPVEMTIPMINGLRCFAEKRRQNDCVALMMDTAKVERKLKPERPQPHDSDSRKISPRFHHDQPLLL